MIQPESFNKFKFSVIGALSDRKSLTYKHRKERTKQNAFSVKFKTERPTYF